MTASTILSQVRQPLATALAGVAANVYDHVPEEPSVPFAAFVPDSPYLELTKIGKSTLHADINLVITVGVAFNNNAAALDNLEQLVLSVLAVIPAGYIVGAVEKPIVTQIAESYKLTADIRVSTTYTQTN